MKKSDNLGGGKGFWSSFVFLFLVTLGLLGMGAYALLKSEGANVSNEMKVLQANATLEGAAYYGLTALKTGKFTHAMELYPVSIGGVNAALDTSKSGSDVIMTVTATNDNASRKLMVQVAMGHSFNGNAIITTGTVTNVTALDSNRVVDTERLVQKADSIPTVNIDSLHTMAVDQGHKIVGNWTAVNNYPMASFFQPDGITPNVTWITGDLTMNGADNIYGIFIVDGDVLMNGTGRIYGVLYLPNVTSTLIHGGGASSGSSIEGAIISHGNIKGTGGHVTVEHNPTYMNEFCEFLKYGMPPVKNKVIRWVYL